MSLTLEQESQRVLRERNTVSFSRGGFIITSPLKITRRHQGKKQKKELLVVMLEESSSVFRDSAYQAIWEHLRRSPKLRVLVTGSRRDITLDQVISSGGFGIVTMTEPVPCHLATFAYYPRQYDTGELAWHGDALHCCSLGTVLPPL